MSIYLVDYGLDMPSSIYDLMRAMKHISVMFFWVKSSSTNYQAGGCYVDKMAVKLYLYPQANNMKVLFIDVSGKKQNIWKAAWSCVLFTLMNSPLIN